MTQPCPICEWISRKEGFIYEDERVVAMLSPIPAVPGHVWVVPRHHAAILEAVPDFVVGDVFAKLGKITTAVFDSLKPEGTNIIVQNGTGAGQSLPHAIVHIVPRAQNDGLPLTWKPMQVSDDDLSTLELKIKEETGSIGAFESEPAKPVAAAEKPKAEEYGPDDYRIRKLRRWV